jgi:hypothetical protein
MNESNLYKKGDPATMLRHGERKDGRNRPTPGRALARGGAGVTQHVSSSSQGTTSTLTVAFPVCESRSRMFSNGRST